MGRPLARPDGTDRSATFDRRADALEHGRAAEAASKATPPGRRRDMTVDQWLDEWLDTVVAPRVAAGTLAPTTAAGYAQKVRSWIRPQLGHLPLVDLTGLDVERMMTAVLAEGRKPRTARHARQVLSTSLTAARRARLIPTNPAADVDLPAVETLPPTAFTVAQLAALTAELEGHRLAPLFRFIVLTGLRASEALGLRWEDVDLDDGTFRIGRTVHHIPPSAARVAPSGLVEGVGKTAVSRAPTRLSPQAEQLLADHRRTQAAARLAAPVWGDPQLVWTTKHGTPLNQGNVRRVYDAALKRTGIPRAKGHALHELRRTFATVALDQGVPLHTVQRLGRWATSDVLLAHYAASDAAAQASGAATVGDALG